MTPHIVRKSMRRKIEALVSANPPAMHVGSYVPCDLPEPCAAVCHCGPFCFYDPTESVEDGMP